MGERIIEHQRLTYQTFLTYADKSGEAGTELVPDLATEVPSAENGGISPDGNVYTFHLKKGIKFAPPISTEATASDFKWTFKRMMKEPLAPATFFYTASSARRISSTARPRRSAATRWSTRTPCRSPSRGPTARSSWP